ncbi:lipase [Haloferula helveola]|uniref:Lipase n=1 Tax=Haloferula helveola TaxID=490095 RepID=A0ABN6H017_9BACT|nr:lipase [Haloferula helveola]
MTTAHSLSRRSLLQGVGSLGVLGALGATTAAVRAETATEPPKKGCVILFQGDSITDAGRDRKVLEANESKALGKGYPALAAGALLGSYPESELKIYNRGISGNKVPDLAERWQADAIDLKPDVLSILVGVNDLWHTLAFGRKYKGTVKDYEELYRALLERTRKELPGTRIVICEPFTTRTSDDFKVLAEYRAVARKLADEMKLTFVPFQSAFDSVLQAAPAEFWLWDGVHPTPAGHELMLQTWRKAVGI